MTDAGQRPGRDGPPTGGPAVPAWVDEIDARPGPPFLSMGVRSLGPGSWLHPIDAATALRKSAVLGARRDAAVVASPEAGPAIAELADLVDAAAPGASGHTGRPRGSGGQGGALASGALAGGAPAAVLEASARRVVEDLCLLTRRDGTWVLSAGCVCFPSHWRLAEKMGRSVADVHGPVPAYRNELADRVDRFIDRLAPSGGAWRRNWLVHADDRLYAPEPRPARPLRAADAGERLWLRSERQTLRRLPDSGAVVFAIRTDQAPLGVLRARPDLAGAMAAAVASWPAELVDYRGGEELCAALRSWLAAPPVA